ncbi:hypothetical protein KBG23_03050 [Candidatus Dojkabacteria bacterium]|nr:hypothetical protein [Candidatus Dojkabacteria bacterium]
MNLGFLNKHNLLIKLPSSVGGVVDSKITPILNTAIALAGLVAVVMIVYGGYTWITSTGDPEKVTQGRNILVAAVIGMMIVFLARMIIGLVLERLGDGGF